METILTNILNTEYDSYKFILNDNVLADGYSDGIDFIPDSTSDPMIMHLYEFIMTLMKNTIFKIKYVKLFNLIF